MKKNLLLAGFVLTTCPLFAQVSISNDNSTADNSAMLDVKSTSKGILIPRLTVEQITAIPNPPEGLMVFCKDCGTNGALDIYSNGAWRSYSQCYVSPPTAGTQTAQSFQIGWNWNVVSGATGYKWNTTNNYTSALDVGPNTSKIEVGLSCGQTYTRYVWAYNGCGYSSALLLSQSTLSCFNCGTFFTVNHVAGTVAPVTKSVTYGTVTNIPWEPTKCWITSNLGADHQATDVSDNTEASSGWYWQFNQAQGYKHTGYARTPNTTWICNISENSEWIASRDPCNNLLGRGWRIPTFTEWSNVDLGNSWNTWRDAWNSALKLHAAGYLYDHDGSLLDRGSHGLYWSSTQLNSDDSYDLIFEKGSCGMGSPVKANAYTVRCIRD